MQYDEFLSAVARRVPCEPHRARAASKAVVRALAELVGAETLSRAATQLPGPLQEQIPLASAGRHLDVPSFYGRVTELGGVETVHDPEEPIRAVIATLHDALPEGAMEMLVEHLPAEYDDLLPESSRPGS